MAWNRWLFKTIYNALAFRSGSTVIRESDQMADSGPNHRKLIKVWTAAIALLILLGIVYAALYPYTSSFESTFTVTTKSIKQLKGDKNQTYLVGTNNGSFKIEDNWSHWQFRSFDIYSQLQEGKTYRGKAYGWRSGIFSAFPNLYHVEEISK